MVWRWFAGSPVAHSPTRPGHKPKRTKTGQVRPQPGQASANYDRLRGEGRGRGGGGGGGRRGERFDGSEPHPSSRAPQRSVVQSRFWTEGCVYFGRFSRMVIPRAFSKHRPGAPLLENPSRKVFASPATFHSGSGSGSGSVFVRNLGSTRPRTHREPWAMSKNASLRNRDTQARPGVEWRAH